MGDNRGGYDGEVSPVFHRVVSGVAADRPDLVVNTGDMIYGRADGPALRRQWDAYKKAIAPLKMPVYHAPGNHDFEDELSLAIWHEYWGETYYAFEHLGCRFIVLDTETQEAAIGDEQFAWLTRQLDTAGRRPVFVFLHRPLFPKDYAGSSLDSDPPRRDRLHRLFVGHRRNLRAVFMGHEHIYGHDRRDGVEYYITGGAGGPLYANKDRGGFYHYLLVHVNGNSKCDVDVKRVEPP